MIYKILIFIILKNYFADLIKDSIITGFKKDIK